MTISINLPVDQISSLSALDKAAVIYALAVKYCTADLQGFLSEATASKKAGGFNKCKNICLIDILSHVNMSNEDQNILEDCK
jgi:hypothetical protein